MTADALERARELESEADAIRAELSEIYASLATSDEDSLFMRMAERFRVERDDARAELARVNSQLASATTDAEQRASAWEARFRAVESRFLTARTTVGAVINSPLMPRDQVQSTLLLAYERIRDFTP